MKLDDFRRKMISYRKSADDQAKSLKDPYVALDKLRSLYQGFDPDDRRMADQVLSEWTLSDDEAVRFDALALIDDLKILSAVPSLQALASRLKSSTAPGAPYEIKKIDRIVERLKS
jgi:hypothetical protein